MMTRVSAAQTNSLIHAKRLVRTRVWIIFGAIVPLGLWISLAPLSMAVVAPAVVTVDFHRRPVQHLEGGIVRAVMVRDGQSVKAGDPVLILGDVGVEADRNRLRYRVAVERAAIGRLDAEQSLARGLVYSGRSARRGAPGRSRPAGAVERDIPI